MSIITISSHATEAKALKARAHLFQAMGPEGYETRVIEIRHESSYGVVVESADGEPATLAFVAQKLMAKAAE